MKSPERIYFGKVMQKMGFDADDTPRSDQMVFDFMKAIAALEDCDGHGVRNCKRCLDNIWERIGDLTLGEMADVDEDVTWEEISE